VAGEMNDRETAARGKIEAARSKNAVPRSPRKVDRDVLEATVCPVVGMLRKGTARRGACRFTHSVQVLDLPSHKGNDADVAPLGGDGFDVPVAVALHWAARRPVVAQVRKLPVVDRLAGVEAHISHTERDNNRRALHKTRWLESRIRCRR
jgi:hypothetical protein